MFKLRLGLFASVLSASAPAAFAAATTTQARFVTTLGNIDVTLFPDKAPNTVANFLSYVNSGAYDNTFIHRSATGFVIQGGGYFAQSGQTGTVTPKATLKGEPGVSNTRGTLAVALSTGPDSGLNQWFFNLGDNSILLDGTQDGGPFTVFAKVTDAASLAVMDAIAAERVLNAGAPFDQLPVVNFSASQAAVKPSNLIYVQSIDAFVAAGSPDYAIAASPAQLTVKAGQTGTSTLTVTPSNGYTGTINLTCGPLPAGVGCSFAPAKLTFAAGAAAQTSVLTLSTSITTALNSPATGAAGSHGSGAAAGFGGAGGAGSFGGGSALALAAGLFGLACLAMMSRSRRPAGLALVLGVGLIAGFASCGGTSTTSAGPATLGMAVRLTDGTVSHPVNLSITVN